jgi:hypothetical protein
MMCFVLHNQRLSHLICLLLKISVQTHMFLRVL